MKILHLSSALSWRGGEQQIAWLIQELQKLGVSSEVFCAQGSEMARHCMQYEIPFFTYKKRGGISFSTSRQLKKIAIKLQPDFIHLHDSHAHSYGVMSAAFFGLNFPMVLHRRVDFPIGKSFLSKWKYNHAAVSKIICVSKFIKGLVQQSIDNKNRAVSIHSGIDIQRFRSQSKGKLRKILNIDSKTLLIGNIAALAPHKDHFTFVDACALILEQKPSAEFVIIGGDAGTKNSIEEYIIQKNLANKIHLLGFRDDVPALISDIDLFLFSSKTEGLGTSVIDAMAAQLPIVTTGAGGIPEIITHQKNGWLAKVGDAKGLSEGILYAIQNPEESLSWVEEGAIKLKQFDKKQTALKTLEVYQSIKTAKEKP